jgi:hypothetical protein
VKGVYLTIWRKILKAAPTCALQFAMIGRPGVNARFVLPEETYSVTERGVCWVTVNHD